MKRTLSFLHILSLLSVWTILAGGCIREGLEECPNVKLVFRYDADTDYDVFSRYIESVTLFVYDGEGQLIQIKEVDQTALKQFQGTELALKKGEYRIVCWGNASENTEIDPGKGRVQHPNMSKKEKIPTNDRLYYGSRAISIDPEKIQAPEEIRFCASTIRLSIYVKGIGTKTDPGSWGEVKIHNLMPQYNFSMKPACAPSETYYPVLVPATKGEMEVARLNVFRFENDNPVIIEVNDRKSGTDYQLNLKDFMASQQPPLTVEDRQEVEISVLFEFSSLGIKVSVPDWESENITPGV